MNVQATSNSSANTSDAFLELKAPTSTTVLLKRIRVSSHATTPADNMIYIRLNRSSAAGATGTGLTPLRMRQNAPVSVITSSNAFVKNGATAFSIGTVTDTPIKSAVNQRGVWEWIARDKDDYIECGSAAYFNLEIQVSAASQLISAEWAWEE